MTMSWSVHHLHCPEETGEEGVYKICCPIKIKENLGKPQKKYFFTGSATKALHPSSLVATFFAKSFLELQQK